jgi:hypothetical protein
VIVVVKDQGSHSWKSKESESSSHLFDYHPPSFVPDRVEEEIDIREILRRENGGFPHCWCWSHYPLPLLD